VNPVETSTLHPNSQTMSPMICRREAAEAESAAFVGAIPGCDWLKGVEVGRYQQV